MECDDLRPLARKFLELTIPICDVAVRRPMKAISSHTIPSIELIRDRVEVGGLAERLVKRGVEDSDLRNARAEDCTRSGDAARDVRVVERCEIDEGFNFARDLRCTERGLRELLAAVYDAVSDRRDFSGARDGDSGFRARQPTDDILDGGSVIAKLGARRRWI